jgi:hypothetical protein
MSEAAQAESQDLSEEELDRLYAELEANDGVVTEEQPETEVTTEEGEQQELPLEDTGSDEQLQHDQEEAEASSQTSQENWESQYRNAQSTIAQLQQNVRSNSGRVSAYQQKINQLEAQLKQVQATPHAESDGIPQQDAQAIARQVVDDLMSGDEEKAAAALAEALTRGAVGTQQTVDDNYVRNIVNEAVRPFQEAEKSRFRQTQEQTLETIHPDWRDTARSDEFRQWVVNQPESVQTLMQSDSASDAATLLNYFKQSRPAPQMQEAPVPNERVAQIQAKRERQLSQGQTPSTRGGRAVGGAAPDDPDALFEYLERNDPDYGKR